MKRPLNHYSEAAEDEEEFQGFSDQEGGGGGEEESDQQANKKRQKLASKQLLKERKAQKGHAEEIERAKLIWEELRSKETGKDRVQELLDEMFELMGDNISAFIFKHDTCRIIQTVVKLSNASQREQIAQSIKGRYIELAKSSYGKYLVAKLLHYGDSNVRAAIIGEFYGKIYKLIGHAEASYVIEDIYREYSTPQQQISIVQELYGHEFAMFKNANDMRGLKELVADLPGKKDLMLDSLIKVLETSFKKGMFSWTILHRVLREVLENARKRDIEDLLDMLKDHVVEICHTADGATACTLLVAHGGAKERRSIMKSLKPYMQRVTEDEYGFFVIIAAIDCIDDTVALGKLLTEAMKRDTERFLGNSHCVDIILYLLSGKPIKSWGLERLQVLQQCHEIRSNTSKKDAATRRSELINAVSPILIDHFASRVLPALQNSRQSTLLLYTLLFASGDKSSITQPLVEIFDSRKIVQELMTTHKHVPRFFRTLVQGGLWNEKTNAVERAEPGCNVAEGFAGTLRENMDYFATGEGSFILLAHLEASPKNEIEQLVLECRQDIIEAAKKGNKGSALIVKRLNL